MYRNLLPDSTHGCIESTGKRAVCGRFHKPFGQQGSHAPAMRADGTGRRMQAEKLLSGALAFTPEGQKWGCILRPVFRPQAFLHQGNGAVPRSVVFEQCVSVAFYRVLSTLF